MAPGVTGIGSLFPRVRGSIWESCRRKMRRTVARARLPLQNHKQRDQSTFGRWGLQYVHQTVARARFHIKIAKSWHDRSSAGFVRSGPHGQGYADVGRFGAMLHGMWICNRLWPNALAWLRAAKHWCCDSWQAGLQLEVAKRIVREEKNWVAESIEELPGKAQSRVSEEVAEKRLLREEVAKRRGASAKRSLSEKLAQQRSSSLIHP